MSQRAVHDALVAADRLEEAGDPAHEAIRKLARLVEASARRTILVLSGEARQTQVLENHLGIHARHISRIEQIESRRGDIVIRTGSWRHTDLARQLGRYGWNNWRVVDIDLDAVLRTRWGPDDSGRDVSKPLLFVGGPWNGRLSVVSRGGPFLVDVFDSRGYGTLEEIGYITTYHLKSMIDKNGNDQWVMLHESETCVVQGMMHALMEATNGQKP